jgi:hypothetical protein
MHDYVALTQVAVARLEVEAADCAVVAHLSMHARRARGSRS